MQQLTSPIRLWYDHENHGYFAKNDVINFFIKLDPNYLSCKYQISKKFWNQPIDMDSLKLNVEKILGSKGTITFPFAFSIIHWKIREFLHSQVHAFW